MRVNPLVLSVTLEGLEIRGRSGAPWVGVGRLYANAELFPLLWHTAKLKSLEIERPTFQLLMDAEGHPDFADLLPEEGPTTEEAAPSEWMLALDHFLLKEGRFAFEDRGPAEPFKTTLGPINLRLEGFRTKLAAAAATASRLSRRPASGSGGRATSA